MSETTERFGRWGISDKAVRRVRDARRIGLDVVGIRQPLARVTSVLGTRGAMNEFLRGLRPLRRD